MRLFLTGLFVLLGQSIGMANWIEKDPAELATDRVYEWKSADGLRYHYRLPKDYDAEAGAGLTIVLSQRKRKVTLLHLDVTTFRLGDIVVFSEGTTPNESGVGTYTERDEDIERLYALHQELKKALKVNATYLHGSGKGSSLALHYAGAKPEEVQGVVAHSGGLWESTQTPETAHHQAIVFVQGNDSPGLGSGLLSREAFDSHKAMLAAGYPMVRIRAYSDGSTWRGEATTQLAWVEGVTTKDPKRQVAAFKTLTPNKHSEENDYAAFYLLASHLATAPGSSADAQRVSKKAMNSVEELVEKQIAAMSAPDPGAELVLDHKGWVVQLPMILDGFRGVPTADALRVDWSEVLARHHKVVDDYLDSLLKEQNERGSRVIIVTEDFEERRARKDRERFEAGNKILREGYLGLGRAIRSFDFMPGFSDFGLEDLDLDEAEADKARELIEDYQEAKKRGTKKFNRINRAASF